MACGRSQSDRLTIGTRVRLPLQSTQQPVMFNVNYTLGQEKNHADSATSLPSDNNSPDVDWGPSRQDIRHRVQMQAQFPLLFGFRSNVNFNATSGSPYNWTTGYDDNNDGAFNDRPPFFRTTTNVSGGRDINVSLRFNF